VREHELALSFPRSTESANWRSRTPDALAFGDAYCEKSVQTPMAMNPTGDRIERLGPHETLALRKD
jgi:hypothetical protein